MKKLVLPFLFIYGFNSLSAQINTGSEPPSTAPNSGVQTLPPGPQTTGPDFQPTTPYVQPVPINTISPVTPVQPNLGAPINTPSIQTQPNTNTPNNGSDNSIYTTPTNTLNPGSPTTPQRENNY